MDNISKSWFAVLNNPEQHGIQGSPEEICQYLMAQWAAAGEDHTGAWVYCVSADGLHHVHMVLEAPRAMRFSKVKQVYGAAHLEATKGSKAQVLDYINKMGPFEEKGEQVIYTCSLGGIRGAEPGRRSDLDAIAAMIDAGMTPREIMMADISYRRYERLIKGAYYDRRVTETPPIRDVAVHYLVGASGSGKTHTYATLCAEHGEDNIYLLTDFTSGGMDHYAGEPVLFVDELRDQLPYSTLLTMLDRYKVQVHARYANVWALWADVYITSVYAPEQLHSLLVASQTHQRIDSVDQLMRRLSDVTYCWHDQSGYHKYLMPADEYKNLAALQAKATMSDMLSLFS